MEARDGGRAWLRLSYAYAAFSAVLVGYFLMRIPIQVSDCFGDVVSLARPMWDLVRDAVWQQSFLRPGRYVEAKLVFDLAGGEYHYAFRFVHALHMVALVWLFVRLLQPRTAAAAVAVPLALAVLLGSHTFAWTLREAFPINHYLTIVVACLAAANLSFAQWRRWTDAGAVALLASAALTIESGVLVWVILVAGYLVGLRGVSRAGLAAATAVLLAYFVVRFGVLAVGLPTLLDREAGFGFERYGGAALQAMFGGRVWLFYTYNVVTSVTGMLVAEPRDGVFRLVAALGRGEWPWALLIGSVSSVLATALVCHATWQRRRAWLARRFERDDQIIALFWCVLLANAALGYAYTKDVIMAPAGVFYAAAVFVACRRVLEQPSPRALGRAVTVMGLAVLSSTWAIRAVGIHAALADTAVEVREQWVYVDEWIVSRRLPMTPVAKALKQQLQRDAVLNHPGPPLLLERWTRLFEMK